MRITKPSWMTDGEVPKEGKFTPSKLGVIRIHTGDRKIRELHMNRANRRKFLRRLGKENSK